MLNASAVTALTLRRQAARRLSSRSMMFRPRQQQTALARRGKSTATNDITKSKPSDPEFIKQMRYQNSQEFAKKTWLSDPSTYPIFVVLGAALLVCAGRCVHGFFFCDDVKVDRTRKNRIVRSHEEKEWSVTGQSFVSRTFAPVNGDDPVYKVAKDGKVLMQKYTREEG